MHSDVTLSSELYLEPRGPGCDDVTLSTELYLYLEPRGPGCDDVTLSSELYLEPRGPVQAQQGDRLTLTWL